MPAGSISEPQPGAGAPRVAVCALAVFATLAVAVAQADAPRAANGFAVIFPPWWSAAQALNAAASAGDITGVGALPFILVVRSDAPRLKARLRQAGALLLLDPRAAGTCSPPPLDIRP
jgi:hypothetical protein